MATSSRKKAPSNPEPESDHPVGWLPTDELLEPHDAELRQRLGLRPRYYVEDGTKGSHPDQRPCPAWCWLNGTEHEHEIDEWRPSIATHSTNGAIGFPASLYRGHATSAGRVRTVETASIEVDMRQSGQQRPTISVYLRRYNEDREQLFSKVLALSLTDAEELAVALQYWVTTAEADLELREVDRT